MIGKYLIAACVALGASQALALPIQWDGNGHYYDFVSGSYSHEEAVAGAAASSHLGEQGYLVTITSQEEQTFISEQSASYYWYSPFWLGASDAANEGDWRWVTGPEAGMTLNQTYSNWYIGAPNDAFGTVADADYALGNWMYLSNGWQDVPNDPDCGNFDCNFGYIIEYGGLSNVIDTVPLPAGLPLLATAFVGLGIARRRRS